MDSDVRDIKTNRVDIGPISGWILTLGVTEVKDKHVI
jgi:hypothetical protein